MIHAEKLYLKDIFSENSQFIIPFFQRSYSWDEDNWLPLWDSISSLYSGDRKKEHFIGSIIIKLGKSYGKSVECDVVDGQQRLLTLSIILKVLQNEASQQKDKTLAKDIKSFLHLEGINEKRIRTSHLDQACYEYIMEKEKHEDIEEDEYRNNKIFECYKFFQEKIQSLEGISEPDNKLKLNAVITGDKKNVDYKSLAFVRVGLGDEDNEQEIFDTVNSYGVNLLVSDLIKNFIFSDKFWGDRKNAEECYKKYWQYIFEQDEMVTWWDKKISRGRDKIANIEAFLYAFLIVMRTLESPGKAKRVKFHNMFKEYKKIVTEYHKKNKLKELLIQMQGYAITYFNDFLPIIPKDEMRFDEVEKRLFATLTYDGMSLADPLILYCYHNFKSNTKRAKFSSSLDSYLVRRLVCKMPKGDYDTLFIESLSFMANDKGNFNDFIIHATNKNDNIRMPNNMEFKECFAQVHPRNKLPHLLLYSIALKQLISTNDDSRVPYKNTVEHIMPKTWRNTVWQDYNMGYEEELNRDNTIKTIGNLTLVKQAVNSSIGNKSWSRKKAELKKYCRLELTTDFLDKDSWTEDDIDIRGMKLFNIATKVWPYISR